MATAIDLNSDIGESFGPYAFGHDEALLDYVTSANAACGFHAGDPRVMGQLVGLAREKSVAIGAHPGFADLVGFGRREIAVTADEVATDILYQIGALDAFCRAAKTPLQHVKLHGALYNRLMVDQRLATAAAEAIALFDHKLIVVGLPGSTLEQAAKDASLPFAREAFADRAYNSDGTLASRRQPGALFTDPAQVARRAVRMAIWKRVGTIDGGEIELEADTICIHGDTPNAVDIARTVRVALEANNVAILPLTEVLEQRNADTSSLGRTGS